MALKSSFIYFGYVLVGFFLALVLQKFEYRDVLSVLQWIKFSCTQGNTNGTSLALLTLVEPGKKSFSVAVLPTKELQKNDNDFILNHEVSAILHKALHFKKIGNIDKAMKLLRQCKSLNPKHPDVLNYYGEGIEKTDIIIAEHHYALALASEPGHLKANKNRKRCLPRVREMDLKMLQRIEQKREALMKIPEGNAALTRAKLEAYYKHIYHSNGIEGNTMTLSMTRSIVETGIAVGGKSVIEHNEVLGMDAALKYINMTLLSNAPVSLDDILQIHKRVLGYSSPLDAGYYRQTQVYVGDHVPPSPMEMHKYLDAFQKWLMSPDIKLLHPIELATLAHYKLVYIHPFLDGNGRTSRLLMNLFLMRAGYPPVIIRKEQRYDYYEYLQTANLGDVRPFIRFVARCTEETLDEYLSSVTVGKLQMVPNDDSTESTDMINFENECFNPFHQASSLTQDGDRSKCEKKKT